jgi:hypothetical protein
MPTLPARRAHAFRRSPVSLARSTMPSQSSRPSPSVHALLEGGIIAVGHHRQIVGRPIQRQDDTGATLNLGDCFAYSLATVMHEPLLSKGNDFVHTDVKSALDQS